MVCPPQAALNSGANLVSTPQPLRARHSRAAGSCYGPEPAVRAHGNAMSALADRRDTGTVFGEHHERISGLVIRKFARPALLFEDT